MDDPSTDRQGPDPEVLEKDGTLFAHHAVKCDKEGSVAMAIFYYNVIRTF